MKTIVQHLGKPQGHATHTIVTKTKPAQNRDVIKTVKTMPGKKVVTIQYAKP